MDHLHVVFSVAAGGRVRIFASSRDSSVGPPTGDRSHRDRLSMRPADGRVSTDMAIAHHARPELEASKSRFSHHSNLWAPARQHRTALLHPINHRATVTGMVRAI